jgi:hypothetical protein
MLRTSRITIVPTDPTQKPSYDTPLLLSHYCFAMLVRDAATAAAAAAAAAPAAAHLALPTVSGQMW